MDEPLESLEALTVVRERVAEYIEQLDDRSKWIINAIDSERKSLAEVAQELNMTKTSVWRIRNQALDQLREMMGMDPVIRKRVVMAENWEQAAGQWVTHFANQDPVDLDMKQLYEYRNWMRDCVVNDDPPGNTLFTRMATMCVSECRRRGIWDAGAMTTLLAKKQSDYGHGNINAFGLFGLVVRISDKVERLMNLQERDYYGVAPQNEPLTDTLLDIVGYCVIAAMFNEGTFQLDLGEHYE